MSGLLNCNTNQPTSFLRKQRKLRGQGYTKRPDLCRKLHRAPSRPTDEGPLPQGDWAAGTLALGGHGPLRTAPALHHPGAKAPQR